MSAPAVEAMDATGYAFSDDPARLDLDVVHAFLSDAYWSRGVPREVVERAVAGSLVVGCYAADGSQVGFARAVTDRATFAWLADVFVLPEHRGRGLGRRLVRHLLDRPDLAGLRRWMLATADAHGVYAELGFTPVEDSSRLMHRRRSPEELYGAPATPPAAES